MSTSRIQHAQVALIPFGPVFDVDRLVEQFRLRSIAGFRIRGLLLSGL
jgi:hypothetical protein